MKILKYILSLIVIFSFFKGFAQKDTVLSNKNVSPKNPELVIDSSKQRDMIDILKKILNKNTPANSRLHAKKLVLSVIPAAGYALSTGFAVDLTANMAFYTSTNRTNNLSAIDFESVIDTKNQQVFASRSEIWFDNNNYKLITNLRWEKYPTVTYGLGTTTTSATADRIIYNNIRTYVTGFKKMAGDLYGGIGYNYDYNYNISEAGNANGTVSDFKKYGFTPQSTASAIVLNLLFDNRLNHINPLNGGYASISYRDNFTFLGSDNNWQDLQMDRKYFMRYGTCSKNHRRLIYLR